MSAVYEILLVVLDILQPFFNFYTGVTFVATLVCALAVAPAISPVVPKYKELDYHKKTYWNTLLGSTFHSTVLPVFTLYALLFDQLSEEYIFSWSPIGRALLRFSLGYFCADLILILMDSKMRKETLSIIHHILGVIGIWLGVYYDGVALYWVVYRFITESSTPFVNFLHCMLAVGYPKRSPLFVTNSLLLLIVFYLCRIFIIPYHWYGLYYYVYTDPSMKMIWPVIVQYWMVITYVLFDVLNIVWAYRLTRGGYKVVKQLWKSSE